ncbi:hypothetical protein BC832DRAFT_537482 [Gaertneriomyces semiglobifer]|nr:hypothetical protein BC832DRAFT_537482 [Gaertneriomyces semiglobifer]
MSFLHGRANVSISSVLLLLLTLAVLLPQCACASAVDAFLDSPFGLINVVMNLQANYATGTAADAMAGGIGDWESIFHQVVCTGCLYEQMDIASYFMVEVYLLLTQPMRGKPKYLVLGLIQEVRLRESPGMASHVFYTFVLVSTALADARAGRLFWTFIMIANVFVNFAVIGARELHLKGSASLGTSPLHQSARRLLRLSILLMSITWCFVLFFKPDTTYGTTVGVLRPWLHWGSVAWAFSMLITYGASVLGVMNKSVGARSWRAFQFLIAFGMWGVRLLAYNCALESCAAH